MDTRPSPYTRVMLGDDQGSDDPMAGLVLPPEQAHTATRRCPADEEDMVPVLWNNNYARWEYTEDLTAV